MKLSALTKIVDLKSGAVSSLTDSRRRTKMGSINTLLIALLGLFLASTDAQRHFQPEQLHLSYPDDPTQMYVTWSTMDDPASSICEYGTSSLTNQATGYRTVFVDGGEERRTQIIHRVTLINLVPGTRYWYHCGSDRGWSELFFFSALKDGSDWSPRFALFGDMGNIDGFSVPYLQEETQEGNFDAIIHVGDFAYDMDSNNGLVGDEFMKEIEAIAGYVPYMVCVGNHEQAYNFSNYKNRFTMPHTIDNMFFSYNIGPIHFVSISTEFYYFTQYGFKQIPNQYNWLEADLKEANKPENRALRPWVVVYGHRPMYCSNSDDDPCLYEDSLVRTGMSGLNWYGLENLLYAYGVDLSFWAHDHSYERLWPIYNYTVANGSTEEPYTDPRATVHIITGSAGCSEHHDPFIKEKPYYSAFRSTDYGYTRMHVVNETNLYIEQVSVEQAGAVIDSFSIIKSAHGSFAKLFPEDSF